MNYLPYLLEPSWQKVLKDELKKPFFLQLAAFVSEERERGEKEGLHVFPPKELIFNAFQQTPLDEVRVVIMGQDPYHGKGQAHGLCFSVPIGVPPPPSLKNIYKELIEDVGIKAPTHGSLISWTRQGVLLLNAILTVKEGQPASHQGRGWEQFTDQVITILAREKRPLIFLLWGKYAQEKCLKIPELKASHHYIFQAAHPSPLSAQGFFGCRHFSKTNEALEKLQSSPIDWNP